MHKKNLVVLALFFSSTALYGGELATLQERLKKSEESIRALAGIGTTLLDRQEKDHAQQEENRAQIAKNTKAIEALPAAAPAQRGSWSTFFCKLAVVGLVTKEAYPYVAPHAGTLFKMFLAWRGTSSDLNLPDVDLPTEGIDVGGGSGDSPGVSGLL